MLDVFGQDRAITRLQKSLVADRLAHALIFAGPRGVGKFRLALRLAQTVLCEAPISLSNQQVTAQYSRPAIEGLPVDFQMRLPCGKCNSCIAINAGNLAGDLPAESAKANAAAQVSSHPDVHIIRKELNRLYDKTGKSKSTNLSTRVIRAEITGGKSEDVEYESRAFKKSILGRGKFFIIDEAELMEPIAQNVLLKTLEEPPPQTFIIMVTSEPDALLATIKSRAQVVPFQHLSIPLLTQLIKQKLATAPQATGLLGQGEQGLGIVTRLAGGSLGQALHFAEDIRLIEERSAEKSGRAKEAVVEEVEEDDNDASDSPNPAKSKKVEFTPGGVIGWTYELSRQLDGLLDGRTLPSELAGGMGRYAAEYADLLLKRDPLSSLPQANRNGLGLIFAIAGEYFNDRMRASIGKPADLKLPSTHGGLDPILAQVLIQVARHAESLIDLNANQNLVLSALANEWHYQLHNA